MSKELNKTLDQRIDEIFPKPTITSDDPEKDRLMEVVFNFQFRTTIKDLIKEVLATVRPEELPKLNYDFGIRADEEKRLTNRDAEERAWGYNQALAEYDENCRKLLNENR